MRGAKVCLLLLIVGLILWAKHVGQWFSNSASRPPGASFQFSKGIVEYFGFVPLSLGFIASKEL